MNAATDTSVPRSEFARPSPARSWAAAFAFWTLLTLSYGLAGGLSSLSEGRPPAWPRAFGWNATDFYLWMLLTPLIGRLGRATAAGGWKRLLAVHAPASLAITLGQTLLQLAAFWLAFGPGHMPTQTLGGFVTIQFAYKFQQGLVCYWVILAVLRGMESRRRLRDERLRSAALETQLVQSQLQALRMQLQPHFLFNTLNAISALALSDPAQARLMIARLADFLRLTLEERHAQQVPLTRELQFLECYLAIQQVRFQDRLGVQWEVHADTHDAAVPHLILQPLVENALRHGLLAKADYGRLCIAAQRVGDELYLSVDDDGLGLPPDGAREGIGLGNTRARLRMLFGDAARLELRPRLGGGTCAEVRLPFVTGAA